MPVLSYGTKVNMSVKLCDTKKVCYTTILINNFSSDDVYLIVFFVNCHLLLYERITYGNL